MSDLKKYYKLAFTPYRDAIIIDSYLADLDQPAQAVKDNTHVVFDLINQADIGNYILDLEENDYKMVGDNFDNEVITDSIRLDYIVSYEIQVKNDSIPGCWYATVEELELTTDNYLDYRDAIDEMIDIFKWDNWFASLVEHMKKDEKDGSEQEA